MHSEDTDITPLQQTETHEKRVRILCYTQTFTSLVKLNLVQEIPSFHCRGVKEVFLGVNREGKHARQIFLRTDNCNDRNFTFPSRLFVLEEFISKELKLKMYCNNYYFLSLSFQRKIIRLIYALFEFKFE